VFVRPVGGGFEMPTPLPVWDVWGSVWYEARGDWEYDFLLLFGRVEAIKLS
jgi:hypothetical protein